MAQPPPPIRMDGGAVDLSARFAQSSAVAGSPAAGSITTVCSLTVAAAVSIVSGIQLEGYVALTVGTNGVSAKLDIRQTSSSGTVVATTGALTVVAANLVTFSVAGFDTAATLPGQVYVLCLTIGSGSAVSTVSAAQLTATIY